MLLGDSVVRTPPSGLNDSTVWPAFFIAPAIKPRTVCFCQPIFSMISGRVAPSFRSSMPTTWAVLLPSRTPLALGASAFLDGFAAFFFAAGLAAVSTATMAACPSTSAATATSGLA